MLPYIEQPVFNVFGATLSAFGLLAAMAAYTGIGLVRWQAPRYGLDRHETTTLTLWTVFAGLLGSHVFAVAAYDPGSLAASPLELLNLWGAMSSMGGIFGGILGVLLLLRLKQWSAADSLRFVDMVAWAFPFAWCFGRLGCALAHDHIGIESTSLLAVDFPGGPRFDLGLLEWLLTLPIAGLFLLLFRRRRPAGFYIALFFTLYAPARFMLDFLRVDDARYAGLTPAQFLCLGLAVVGPVWLIRLRRSGALSQS